MTGRRLELGFRVVRTERLKVLQASEARLASLERNTERHLINWQASLRYELSAKEVWCLSPNLKWARAHIRKILGSLSEDQERIFRYIVFDNRVSNNATLALTNAELILNEAAKHPNIANRDGIQILFLKHDGAPCFWRPSDGAVRPRLESDEWTYLPFPTDLAVFVDTPGDLDKGVNPAKATFAVMSLLPIDETLPQIVLDALSEDVAEGSSIHRRAEAATFLWDIKLPEQKHYDPIRWWFKRVWEEREHRQRGR